MSASVRHSPSPGPFSRLPQELLDNIIDLLVDGYTNEHDRRQALLKYTFVSKAWLSRCSKYILRRVLLTNAVLDLFTSAAKHSERLALNTSEIVLYDWVLDTKPSKAAKRLDELLRAMKHLQYLELFWRDGQSAAAPDDILFEPENLPALGTQRHAIAHLCLESPPRAPLASAFAFVTALVHTLRLFARIGTLEVNVAQDIASLADDDRLDVDALAAVVRAHAAPCAVSRLEIFIGSFSPSRVKLAVALLRAVGSGAESLKIRAHGWTRFPPPYDLSCLAGCTNLHSIDLIIGNHIVFEWLTASLLPHLPLGLRHLSIWLNPQHAANIVANSHWEPFTAALERCRHVKTLEFSGICPEMHEGTVKGLVAKLPRRFESVVTVRHLRVL